MDDIHTDARRPGCSSVPASQAQWQPERGEEVRLEGGDLHDRAAPCGRRSGGRPGPGRGRCRSRAGGRSSPAASCPLARVGQAAPVPRNIGERGSRLTRTKSMIASRPTNQNGFGGMVSVTSSVSRAAIASKSRRPTAAMYRSSTARWPSVGTVVRQSARCLGRCSRRVGRARCSALLTEATLVSSASAVSAAVSPSASRSTSAARWRGGRCWIAASRTSSRVSRDTAADSGDSSSTGIASRASRRRDRAATR